MCEIACGPNNTFVRDNIFNKYCWTFHFKRASKKRIYLIKCGPGLLTTPKEKREKKILIVSGMFLNSFRILTHFTVAPPETKKNERIWRNRRNSECFCLHVETSTHWKFVIFRFWASKCVERCTLSLVLSEVIDCSCSLAKIVLFWFQNDNITGWN